MNPKQQKEILWIDDDEKTLVKHNELLEANGWRVDISTEIYPGVRKILQKPNYDLIIIDLLIPAGDPSTNIPRDAKSCVEEHEDRPGLGLLMWLKDYEKINCPLFIYTVIPSNPIKEHKIDSIHPMYYLHKKEDTLDTKPFLAKIKQILS